MPTSREARWSGWKVPSRTSPPAPLESTGATFGGEVLALSSQAMFLSLPCLRSGWVGGRNGHNVILEK